MLRELHIENFALIQNLTVAFSDGLNILTGETGAGKSIIIDALNQVLGQRASTELVRSGEEMALITAVVDVNPEVLARLAELGLETREGCVILQREIYAKGNSQARVDGRPVNVAVLREIGSMLVEIHGQHEHQTLLEERSHLSLVDAYGGSDLEVVATEYRSAWQELVGLNNEISSLHGDQREREHILDLLRYQVNEIAAVGLTPGEEESLLSELKLLQNARKLLEICHSSYQSLYESDQSPVVETLGAIVSGLKDFRELDASLEQACTQLEQSLYAVEDAAYQLRSFADKFSYDPHRQKEIEERLEIIFDLKRKYADSIEEILAWKLKQEAEIENILNTEARHSQLSEMIINAKEKAGRLAMDLSHLRHQAGKNLGAAIVDELDYLQMAKTRFQVEFECLEGEEGLPVGDKTLAAGATGIDNVRFLISPNPGEPLKPLAKTASGGEMSRIMLAILSVLANLRPVQTMIFDEIDAGIGGRAAQAVAEKLATVAVQRQVICVSHLPQVTSMADTHLNIYKAQAGERTLTKVSRLDVEGRVEELARMLGGAEVTAATREHAREMLSLASKLKTVK